MFGYLTRGLPGTLGNTNDMFNGNPGCKAGRLMFIIHLLGKQHPNQFSGLAGLQLEGSFVPLVKTEQKNNISAKPKGLKMTELKEA